MSAKQKKINCTFINEKIKEGIPHIKSLRDGSVAKGVNQNLTEHKFAFEFDIKQFITQINDDMKITFVWLHVTDTNRGLTVLQGILSQSMVNIYAFYQVYGHYDFIIELSGHNDDICRTIETIKKVLKEDNLLSSDPEPLIFPVNEIHRYCCIDMDEDAKTLSKAWIINPEAYKAIRAFTYCHGNEATKKNRSNRQNILRNAKRHLKDIELNCIGTAWDLLDSAYFDDRGNCLFGWLIPCGNYYDFNDATNAMDVLLDVDLRMQKVTYIVAGVHHYTPHSAEFKSRVQSLDSTVLSTVCHNLEKREQLHISSFQVLQGYYRAETAANELRKLSEEISIAVLNSIKQRANYLLHSPPGIGKSEFIRKIARKLADKCEYKEIALDSCTKDSWEVFLDDVINLDKPVICLLDEINKKTVDQWPFESLRDKLDINTKSGRMYNVVWILAGSEGNSITDLASNIDQRPNGRDCLSRIPKQISLPKQSADDNIVISCCSAYNKASEIGIKLHSIEKSALMYLAMIGTNEFEVKLNSFRLIDERVAMAITKLKAGSDRLLLSHFFTPADEEYKAELLRRLPPLRRLHSKFTLINGG